MLAWTSLLFAAQPVQINPLIEHLPVMLVVIRLPLAILPLLQDGLDQTLYLVLKMLQLV